eukprot:g14519.t1
MDQADTENPLQGGVARDDLVIMPSLRKLLPLATQATEQQEEAIMDISKVVERRSVDLSSFDLLCQILTRVVASQHQPVVEYAARSLKFLVLDDARRPQAAMAGILSVLAAALVKWQGDTECLREVVGAKTAAARSYADLDRSRAVLERERAEVEAAAAKVAEREMAAKAKEAAIVRREQRFAAKQEAAQWREQQRIERAAAAAMQRLSPKTSSAYLHETKEQIGHEKVRLVNNHWWERRELYETTSAGRGKTAKKDDRRRCLTEQQEEQLQGWFKSKGGGKGKRGGKDFNLEDEETAEFLWQAKLAKGDYNAAMTDSMFMECLARRLSPAYKAVPDFTGKKMILILDTASYHHGFDAEVKVPETNTKKCVELLRRYGVRSIKVKRAGGNGKVVQQRFEVPTDEGSTLPDARREGGVSREEVATATREYFRVNHPEKLEERVETFMREKGWELIWTPPCMPTFQPIELFRQHGKQYVSLNFELKRKMQEVWVQIRKGWYGDPAWAGQKGGWKAANCSNLVAHVIGEMNKWVKHRDTVLSGMIGALNVPAGYDPAEDVSPAGDVEDGVGEEIEQESSGWEGDNGNDAIEA